MSFREQQLAYARLLYDEVFLERFCQDRDAALSAFDLTPAEREELKAIDERILKYEVRIRRDVLM